jgi:hypothetical protein
MSTSYTVNVDHPPRVIRITPDGFSGTLTSVKAAPHSAPLDLVFYDGPPAFVGNGHGNGVVYATQNVIAACRMDSVMAIPIFDAVFTDGLWVVSRSYSSFVVTIDEVS